MPFYQKKLLMLIAFAGFATMSAAAPVQSSESYNDNVDLIARDAPPFRPVKDASPSHHQLSGGQFGRRTDPLYGE